MDLRNHQNEWVEMVTKLKAEFEDMNLKLQLDCQDTEITRKQLRHQNDKYIASQQNLLDKGSLIEQNDLAVSVEVELGALFKKALYDQHAAFIEKIKQERVVFNQVLSKVLEENEANLKKERAKFDSLIKQAEELMDKELDNGSSKFKSLIDSLVEQEEVQPLIQEEEARANMNVQKVQHGMYISRHTMQYGMYIRRHNFQVLMDNVCYPNVIMRFRIHQLKELYPELKKYYDSREENIGVLTITTEDNPENTVLFVTMLEFLRQFGYIGEAQLYYLNPAPGSEPTTGLLLIHGQEEDMSDMDTDFIGEEEETNFHEEEDGNISMP